MIAEFNIIFSFTDYISYLENKISQQEEENSKLKERNNQLACDLMESNVKICELELDKIFLDSS
jgi:hypothetical protein